MTQPAAERAAVALLVERATDGSQEAFGQLVERFQASLFRFHLVRCGSEEDARELVQETFLRAWSKLHLYDAQWSFSTWLFTLGRRLFVSRRRAEGARPVLEFGANEELPEEVDASDPVDVVGARDEESNVWLHAARVLGEEQRTALWMRYVEDLSIEEIARALGKRRVTVRVLLFRARERLARHLGGRAGSRDDPAAAAVNAVDGRLWKGSTG